MMSFKSQYIEAYLTRNEGSCISTLEFSFHQKHLSTQDEVLKVSHLNLQLSKYLSDAANDNEEYMDASSLVSIATSQINSAGPECISDRAHRIRFAQWNRHAGNAAAGLSSFSSALYFYKFGDDMWLEGTYCLSLKLHEGACKAYSALAEVDQIATYSNAIIANTTVLEDSLVAHYLLIRALTVKGDHRDAVARGVAVLCQIKFAMPEQPTPLAVMQSLRQTEQEAEMYDFSRIEDK